jgi:hypothetical protein
MIHIITYLVKCEERLSRTVLLHYVNSSSSPYLQFKENMLFLPRSIVTKKLTKPDRTLNIILFFLSESCHLAWWKRLWMCRSCMISHFAGRFEWVHMLDTHASFDPLRRYAYTCVLCICDICSKSFYRKDELIEHMYTHNVAMDQNLHVCPTCGLIQNCRQNERSYTTYTFRGRNNIFSLNCK